jgi:VWFA-related protein
MTDDDRAAIVITSGGGQDYSGDREALIAALNPVRGRAMTQKARSAELEIQARQTLNTIAEASTWLGDARGRRKILFLVSDEVGCAAGATGPVPCGLSLSDAVTSARRADVSVYPLHTGGLDVPDCLQAKFAGGAPEGCGGVTLRARGPLSPLSVLATETGGFMINDTNNFDGVFDRVMRENSLYYLVGYYSNNGKHDGKFRKNELMLTRKDLRVQYRPGYTAPRIQ